MKITKCDRCGKEFVGRNPEGFAEHVIDKRIYIDLCLECDSKYVKLLSKLENQTRIECEKFLNEYIKKNPREGQTFDEYLNEQLKDSEFKKEWEALDNEN